MGTAWLTMTVGSGSVIFISIPTILFNNKAKNHILTTIVVN